MASHRKQIYAPAPGMYGVSLEDPRRGYEPLALYIDHICPVVMRMILAHHHPDQRGFEVSECQIGPPRGKHSGIARIEIIYRREAHGWRQVFAVTDSEEGSLRLWTEVRRHFRQA